MNLEAALRWLYEHRAFVRFFEYDDPWATRPTIRLTVRSSNLEDRASTLYVIPEGQGLDEAIIAATMEVKGEYDRMQADLVATGQDKPGVQMQAELAAIGQSTPPADPA